MKNFDREAMEIAEVVARARKEDKTELTLRNRATGEEIKLDISDLGEALKQLRERAH